jgi:TM2 domain-containing membrane protein YozV
MFCPKCGKEVPDTASFCPYCGASLKPAETVKAEPVNNTGASSDQAYVQRSVLAAGLLGIFLGCYGIHNFYLGYKSKAIAQLILGLCVITLFVSAIWGLIEGIQILIGDIAVDGNGHPLKRDI